MQLCQCLINILIILVLLLIFYYNVLDPALLQEFMNSGITFTSTNNSRIIDYNPEELIDDESATTSSITIDSSLDEQNGDFSNLFLSLYNNAKKPLI